MIAEIDAEVIIGLWLSALTYYVYRVRGNQKQISRGVMVLLGCRKRDDSQKESHPVH